MDKSEGISTVRFRALRHAQHVVPYRRPGATPTEPLAPLDDLLFAKVDGRRNRQDLAELLMISDLEVARVLESLEKRGLIVVDRGELVLELFEDAGIDDDEIDGALSLIPDGTTGGK